MTSRSRLALGWPPIVTRVAWAVTSCLAFWSAIAVHGWSSWILVFLLLPDLPLFAGGGPGLERGQLHPRAVPWYNASHHPLLALLAVAVSWLPWQAGATMPAMAALTWVAHIALDRCLGYGLRDRTGRQRAAFRRHLASQHGEPSLDCGPSRAGDEQMASTSSHATRSTVPKPTLSTGRGAVDVMNPPSGRQAGEEF